MVACGAVLILRPPHHVLVGEETAPARRGQIATAAGKCEAGETTLECAVREAAEELRHVIDPARCRPSFSFTLDVDARRYEVEVYTVDSSHAAHDPGLPGHHPMAHVRYVSRGWLVAACADRSTDVAEVLRRAVRWRLL